MGKRQRKTKYEIEIFPKLELIGVWKQNGLTDEEVWKKLNISKNTFYKYKKEHEEFKKVIENGKEEADAIVQNTAYKMATGFFIKIPKYFKERRVYYDSQGRKCEDEIYVEKEVTEYIPPSPTMNIFWLRNRKSSEWNKQIGHISEADTQNGGVIEIPMADMEPETEIVTEES